MPCICSAARKQSYLAKPQCLSSGWAEQIHGMERTCWSHNSICKVVKMMDRWTTHSFNGLVCLFAGMSNDRITLIPVQQPDSSGTITAQLLLTASPSRTASTISTCDSQAGGSRPRRTGSLALFFRKVGNIDNHPSLVILTYLVSTWRELITAVKIKSVWGKCIV